MKAYPIPFRCQTAEWNQIPAETTGSVRKALTERSGAVLYGATGTGKTCVMICAMRAIAADLPGSALGPNIVLDSERNTGCAFIDWPEFVAEVDRHESALHSALSWRGPMFVDDVGQELAVASGYKQGWAESLFDRFVNRRTGIDTPLWITTNLTPNEMRDRYGERALSRLSQHCVFVKFSGADRRLHAV